MGRRLHADLVSQLAKCQSVNDTTPHVVQASSSSANPDDSVARM